MQRSKAKEEQQRIKPGNDSQRRSQSKPQQDQSKPREDPPRPSQQKPRVQPRPAPHGHAPHSSAPHGPAPQGSTFQSKPPSRSHMIKLAASLSQSQRRAESSQPITGQRCSSQPITAQIQLDHSKVHQSEQTSREIQAPRPSPSAQDQSSSLGHSLQPDDPPWCSSRELRSQALLCSPSAQDQSSSLGHSLQPDDPPWCSSRELRSQALLCSPSARIRALRWATVCSLRTLPGAPPESSRVRPSSALPLPRIRALRWATVCSLRTLLCSSRELRSQALVCSPSAQDQSSSLATVCSLRTLPGAPPESSRVRPSSALPLPGSELFAGHSLQPEDRPGAPPESSGDQSSFVGSHLSEVQPLNPPESSRNTSQSSPPPRESLPLWAAFRPWWNLSGVQQRAWFSDSHSPGEGLCCGLHSTSPSQVLLLQEAPDQRLSFLTLCPGSGLISGPKSDGCGASQVLLHRAPVRGSSHLQLCPGTGLFCGTPAEDSSPSMGVIQRPTSLLRLSPGAEVIAGAEEAGDGPPWFSSRDGPRTSAQNQGSSVGRVRPVAPWSLSSSELQTQAPLSSASAPDEAPSLGRVRPALPWISSAPDEAPSLGRVRPALPWISSAPDEASSVGHVHPALPWISSAPDEASSVGHVRPTLPWISSAPDEASSMGRVRPLCPGSPLPRPLLHNPTPVFTGPPPLCWIRPSPVRHSKPRPPGQVPPTVFSQPCFMFPPVQPWVFYRAT
ncbi:hypothetical protein WMY93_032428 [Mugilogobius chulae]|uniref:Uncharacterized protein n=1 Tax=Mugilogobius chulae TaxID=88201 RepID=A0AAW0MN89_9GOBI